VIGEDLLSLLSLAVVDLEALVEDVEVEAQRGGIVSQFLFDQLQLLDTQGLGGVLTGQLGLGPFADPDVDAADDDEREENQSDDDLPLVFVSKPEKVGMPLFSHGIRY